METTQKYITELQNLLELLPIGQIEKSIELLHHARRMGKKIFIIGNGGSAATASHMACDLSKNTKIDGLRNIICLDLTSQPIMTAYANDRGYKNIFVDQLENLIGTYDVLIAISTSGNSPNIVNAVEYAVLREMVVVTMTGFDKGKLRGKGHINIHIPSNCIEQVEDCHLIIGHIFTQQLKELALKEL